MLFRPSFVVFIFALTALGSPAKRNAATVQADLQTVNTKCLSLDQAIAAFPSSGGTLIQALAIHKSATALEDATATATSDTEASGPFTEAEGEGLLKYIKETLSVNILKSLSDISAKSEALTDIGANEIAASDLQNLHEAADALGNAMKPKTPADQQAEVAAIINEIDAGFISAINRFS